MSNWYAEQRERLRRIPAADRQQIAESRTVQRLMRMWNEPTEGDEDYAPQPVTLDEVADVLVRSVGK